MLISFIYIDRFKWRILLQTINYYNDGDGDADNFDDNNTDSDDTTSDDDDFRW